MTNGPAYAGSFENALGCDIRIASELSSFALTEVPNAGSFPGAGGPIRLAKLLGRGRASFIVLTGLRATKILIRQSIEMDMSSAMILSRALRDPLDGTHDSAEGYAAWMEKRKPIFTSQ